MAEKTLIQLDINGKDSDAARHQWKRWRKDSDAALSVAGPVGEAVSQAEAGLIVIPRTSIGVPGPRVFYCIDQ